MPEGGLTPRQIRAQRDDLLTQEGGGMEREKGFKPSTLTCDDLRKITIK